MHMYHYWFLVKIAPRNRAIDLDLNHPLIQPTYPFGRLLYDYFFLKNTRLSPISISHHGILATILPYWAAYHYIAIVIVVAMYS